jgi:hypothetical protein
VVARVKFSNAVTIDRPVHDVFAFVSDLENVPKWNYAIVETRKISSGPVAVGTRYLQIRSEPRRSEESLEVIDLEPDRRLAVRGDLGPFVGTLVYEFEEMGDATRLTNDAALAAHGALKMAAPVMSGRVRDAVAANLRVLKVLLENA